MTFNAHLTASTDIHERMQRFIYPGRTPEFAGPGYCLTDLPGVDDCYVNSEGHGVVAFTDGSLLSMVPGMHCEVHCTVCDGTWLAQDDSGDACEACTYWLNGEPCQTAEHAFAEVCAHVGSFGGLYAFDATVWDLDRSENLCVDAAIALHQFRTHTDREV